MKKIIAKPHLFFFGLVPIFFIIGLIKKENYINLSIDYLNFDLDISLLCNISAVFFLLIGFNYFSIHWTQKKPKNILTIIHILLQLIAVIPFIILIFSINSNESSTSYFTNSSLVLIVSFLVFILSIFIHLINFFTSLFLKTE